MKDLPPPAMVAYLSTLAEESKKAGNEERGERLLSIATELAMQIGKRPPSGVMGQRCRRCRVRFEEAAHPELPCPVTDVHPHDWQPVPRDPDRGYCDDVPMVTPDFNYERLCFEEMPFWCITSPDDDGRATFLLDVPAMGRLKDQIDLAVEDYNDWLAGDGRWKKDPL